VLLTEQLLKNSVKYCMNKKDDYYERVYEIVAQIPKGKASTYGAIARYLGIASGARMVGYALNKVAETNIPAHRVVNRNGELTGAFTSPMIQCVNDCSKKRLRLLMTIR